MYIFLKSTLVVGSTPLLRIANVHSYVSIETLFEYDIEKLNFEDDILVNPLIKRTF